MSDSKKNLTCKNTTLELSPVTASPHSSTEEEPAVSSIEVKSDDNLETQPILSETTTAHQPANDKVSIPESTLILKETPETAFASQPEEVATKTDAADDKETILPSVIDNSESPTIVASVDEKPTDQTQPEATVEVKVGTFASGSAGVEGSTAISAVFPASFDSSFKSMGVPASPLVSGSKRRLGWT